MRPNRLLPVLAAAILAAGCYKDEPLGADRSGNTRVLLTDAPFPYDSVARVDVYIVDILASSEPDTTSLGQWWTLVDAPNRAYNLLDLQQGRTALVGEGQLPAGLYRAVRLVIDTDSSAIWARADVDASGNPITGRSPLPINWGSSAGRPALFALVEPALEVGDDGGEIVIDFDVGRSFFPVYGGGFVFSPVLRAVNEAETGAIEGQISGDTLAESGDPIRDVTITVYSGNPAADALTWSVRATGRTDAAGHFKIAYLLPGTYIVRSDAPRSSPYSPGVRSGVVVTRGATTTAVDIRLPRRAASSFTVQPNYRTIRVGVTDTLRAFATDEEGRPITGAAVSWHSSDTTIARVTPWPNQSTNAYVLARRPGTAYVTASWDTRSDVAQINVVADTGLPPRGGPVETVSIYPETVNLYVGDSTGFMATLRDSAGMILRDRIVTWTSSDETVLKSLCCGVYRAVRQGSATVTATSEGKSGTASAVVLP